MECHFGPARYRFESTGTVPVRSAFTERHSTGSNAADGSGSICSFSDSNRLFIIVLFRAWSPPDLGSVIA